MATKSIKPVNGECPEGYVWDSGSNSCVPTSYKYTPSNLGEPKWSSQQSDDDYISELVKIGVSEEDAKKRLQEKKKIQLDVRNKVFAKGGEDAVKLLDLVNSGADLTKHQDLIEKVTKTTGISKSFPDNEDVFGFISIADNISRASNPEYYKKKEEEKQLQELQQIPEKRKKLEQELRSEGADQEEIDYELKRFDSGNKGIGFAEYKAQQQQQVPVSKLVTPPVTTQVQATIPQVQTEPVVDNRLMPGGADGETGMNQSAPVQNSALQDIIASAQSTPVINTQTPKLTPQTPQTYGVQEDPFAGVGAQPIQERTMPDTDKPSLFQGLRNLIGNLFQGGKATTPEQPVNVQAPPAQQVVAQEEAKPDAKVAQVNAATPTPTTPTTTNVKVPKVNPVTNVETPQANAVAGGASALGGLSGGTAMPATEGQPTDVAVAEANTGTIPASVVKPVATTPVTYPGTQTAVTPQASGDLPLNFSFEEDLTAKGKQASGDVKSQAMYDLAQEALNRGDMRGAEAILRRPLNNQDFFPGPGLQQARTAWGDPLFTGAGQLFPMAVMDARQKAMAEAEAMAMREEALNFEIPKIEVAGLRNNYSQTFVSDAERLVSEAIAKHGNRRNAIKELKRSGEWARFMAEHKATADAINYTGKEAQTYLKNAKEGQLKGETYATPEALAAAQAYLLGLKEWGSGQINNTQLNELAEQFKVWESWDKYEKNSRDRIKPTDISAADLIAQQAAEKATQEDIVAFSEAVRLNLPGSTRGMKAWLYNKKISEVLAPQIRAAVIEPFFASNPSAERQFQARYPNKNIEEIKNLVAEQYAMGYGRQVEPGQIAQTSKGGFSINVGGDKSKKTGVYQNTVNAIGDITKYVKDNLTKLPIDKILSEAPKYGEAQGSWKPLPNYFGFELPGVWDIANQTTTPSKFNEYIYEVADKIPNKLTMKWLTAKDALQGKFNGDIPENMVPTGSKIKDVSIVYGVKDNNSAGGYKILDKEYVKSRGLPDNAEPLFLQKEELIFDINEAQQQTGGGMRSLEDRGVTPKKAGETRVSRSAYKIYPVTEVSARMYDQQVSTSSGTASPAGKGKNIQVSGSIDGDDFSSLD